MGFLERTGRRRRCLISGHLEPILWSSVRASSLCRTYVLSERPSYLANLCSDRPKDVTTAKLSSEELGPARTALEFATLGAYELTERARPVDAPTPAAASPRKRVFLFAKVAAAVPAQQGRRRACDAAGAETV